MWFVCVSLPHACMHSQELGMLLMRLWMAPGGSPPRPGSGQDHWSFAQFVELLSSIELGTHFRCSQLDSGLRTIKDCQWCQCLCCLGTVYTLWLHEVGHCPAPGGTQAQFTSIRIKKMGLRISSWYLAAVMIMLASTLGSLSPCRNVPPKDTADPLPNQSCWMMLQAA